MGNSVAKLDDDAPIVPIVLRKCATCKVLRCSSGFFRRQCGACFRKLSIRYPAPAPAAGSGLAPINIARRCCLCHSTSHASSRCPDSVAGVVIPPENLDEDPGLVYVVEGVGTESVKIGSTINLEKRFWALQSSSPVELRLLCIERGGRNREAALHKTFARDRMHGEWFHISDELRAYIHGLTGEQC